MKQKLLNSIRLRAMMLVAVMCAAFAGQAWGQDPTVLFHETFGDNTGSARDWNNSYSVKSGVSAVYSGITGYTVSNAKQGKNTTGSTKSGLNQSTSGTDAYIIIGPLNVADYESLHVTYQWKATSTKGTYSTKLEYATSSGGAYSEVSGTGTGATTFVERSYTLPVAAQVNTLYLKITWNTSNTQAIIDEVELTGVAGGGGSSAVETTTTINATGITNTNVFAGTAAGSLSASVTYGDPAAAVPAASVTWSGDNDEVATINSSTGAVTLVGAGTVTFTATYAGVDDEYQSSSTTYEMTVINEDPSLVEIWSEDFASSEYSTRATTYSYELSSGTAVQSGDNYAGGEAPELMVKASGTFSATIPLNNGYAGDLKMKFKSNANSITVSSGTKDVSMKGTANFSEAGTHEVTFTGITAENTEINIVFTAGSKNVRLDDIVLKGSVAIVPITSIAFTEPKTASVVVGYTETLTPTVLPAYHSEAVDWESDDTDVATVNSAGVVTAIAAGTAHITAKAHDNPSTIYDVCTVTVTAPVSVTGVSLNKTSTTLLLGGTETLTATVAPLDATNKNVTWTSADDTKVSVENGVITALALTGGSPVNITVTTEDGDFSATCAVTVDPIHVTEISLNKTSTTIEKTKTETLTPTITPSNATNKNVTWESDNTDVATVSDAGVVTGVAVGVANITVTTEDGGYTATCEVTVVNQKGTADTPYSVAEVINGTATGSEKYVVGYIVGCYDSGSKSKFGRNGSTNTNLAIADDPEEEDVDHTVAVQLPSGTIRTNFNVKDNIHFIGSAKVLVCADIIGYITDAGLKNTESIAKVAEIVKVTSAGFATWASDSPLDFTDKDIDAYIAITKGDGTGVTFTQINKVPANTGVLLHYEGGKNEEIPVFDGSAADDVTGNVFLPGTGEAVDSEVGSLRNYILNKPSEKPIGFYRAAGQTVAKNRAYIQIDESTPVKGFIALPGFEETAVETVKAEAEDGVIFNLAGQRVQKLQRGINIVNGRKVVVK